MFYALVDRLAERLTYIDKECTRLKEDELKAETFDEKYTLLKRRVNLRDEDLRLRERQHELQRRSEAFSAPYKDQPTSSLFSSVFAPIEGKFVTRRFVSTIDFFFESLY